MTRAAVLNHLYPKYCIHILQDNNSDVVYSIPCKGLLLHLHAVHLSTRFKQHQEVHACIIIIIIMYIHYVHMTVCNFVRILMIAIPVYYHEAGKRNNTTGLHCIYKEPKIYKVLPYLVIYHFVLYIVLKLEANSMMYT